MNKITYGEVFTDKTGAPTTLAGYVFNKKHTASTRLVYGHGTNDLLYATGKRVNGKWIRWKPYAMWLGMLERAFCPATRVANPSYEGVTVCEEWLLFSGFLVWLLKQPFHDSTWELDKEFVGDGRTYSPETCIIIPCQLNSFLTDHRAARGSFSVGVTFHKKSAKYHARVNVKGRRAYLGAFNTEREAYHAWLDAKLQQAIAMRDDLDKIDPRLYDGVVRNILAIQ